MQLADLRVVHLRKSRLESADAHPFDGVPETIGIFPAEVLRLDSCLRCLWVLDREALAAAGDPVPCAEILAGVEAYAFLLRLASGLESRIVGETDIFGQLKAAWHEWISVGERSARLRVALNPWLQRLFEDTKEVRSNYLQNLGGSSYGTLVRKLLRDAALPSASPVLLVGAGALAEAVAPLLKDYELWLVNRSPEPRDRLAQAIVSGGGRVRVLDTPEAEREGWQKAAQAVLCVPFMASADAERVALWMEGGASRPLIHLGGLQALAGVWTELPGYRTLDDLFNLEQSQDRRRSEQVRQAQAACLEKAKLRTLGLSNAVQHGWEDLALFA